TSRSLIWIAFAGDFFGAGGTNHATSFGSNGFLTSNTRRPPLKNVPRMRSSEYQWPGRFSCRLCEPERALPLFLNCLSGGAGHVLSGISLSSRRASTIQIIFGQSCPAVFVHSSLTTRRFLVKSGSTV